MLVKRRNRQSGKGPSDHLPLLRGDVQLFQANEGGIRWPHGKPTRNQILYAWGTAVSNLLLNTKDGLNYYIGGMYVEFSNSGLPVNPTPTITRDAGRDYYASLANPLDYLRIPISLKGDGSSNESLFPEGNQSVFYAQTAGSVGMNGRTFSDVANSRVYGGALVVFRDPDDHTQDLVFSRFYFASASQLVKVAGQQIGIQWTLTAD